MQVVKLKLKLKAKMMIRLYYVAVNRVNSSYLSDVARDSGWEIVILSGGLG